MGGTNGLLDELGSDGRRAVLARARRRTFARGEVLFHEGDPGDALVLLDMGHVAVRGSTPFGDVVTFGIVGPGEFLGEQLVLGEEQLRTASAIALDRVVAHYLAVSEFEALVRETPSMWRVVAMSAAAQVRRLSQRLLEALYAPAERRVLRRLAELADAFSDVASDRAVVPLTQSDIADLAGTTRPTANQALKALEADGVVQLARRQVTVLQVEELRQRAR